MKIGEATERLIGLGEMAEADGDAFCGVYFSREDDKYRGLTAGMDEGDALLIIEHLVEQFGLDRTALAMMLADDEDLPDALAETQL